MEKQKRCPACHKGVLKPVDDIASEVSGYFFIEKGERCAECGEEFIPEKEGQKMIAVARKMGLWGEPIKLYRKLSKSSRGITLRLPADLQRSMGLKGEEEVALSKAGKRIYVDIMPG